MLPEIQVAGIDNPVFQVINETTNKIVYTIRVAGQTYQPKVFRKGKYAVVVGEPGT